MGACETCGGENSGDAEHCIHCGERLAAPGRCGSCGVINLPSAETCRMCGADLTAPVTAKTATPRERPGYRPKFKTCSRCGRGYDNHLVECPHCESTLPDDYDPSRKSSPIPFIAGTSLFAAGILCILNGIFLGSFGDVMVEFAYCGFIEILMGVVSITGWIFCMQRAHLVYVLIASIVTILSVGPFFFSSLLGVFALILIAVSAKEFR